MTPPHSIAPPDDNPHACDEPVLTAVNTSTDTALQPSCVVIDSATVPFAILHAPLVHVWRVVVGAHG